MRPVYIRNCLGNFLILTLLLSGCSPKPLPSVIYPRAVFPLNHYPISASSDGLKVVALPFEPGRDIYTDPAKPPSERLNLPFNILETKVFPIRVIVINQSEDEFLFDPDQMVGIADDIIYFRYSPQEAVDLIVQSAAYKKAVEGSQVGPFIKSILGGDIIIGALKGGVGGLASGGVTSGATGVAKGASEVSMEKAQGYEKGLVQLISQEYTAQALKRQTLLPGFISDGLLFFPGKIGISRIRIQAYNLQTKKTVSLTLELKK